VSFKEHPSEQVIEAQDPKGNPIPLVADANGRLSVIMEGVMLELSLLRREVAKSNIYLSLIAGEEVSDRDVNL
jgi:hypothetical protein